MIQFEEYGDGQPVVLIHGSPGNAQSWRGVGAHLGAGYRFFAVTLPGHEDEPDAAAPAAPGTAGLAAEVEALIRAVGGPVALAAHSYGGNVALSVALRGEVPLSSLTLFEPVVVRVLPALGLDGPYRELKPVFDHYIARHERGDENAVQTMIDFWFGASAYERLAEPMQTYLQDRTAVNIRDVKAAFAERHSRASLAALAVPTVVAYGTASPAATRTIVEALAGALGSGRTVAVEGADHAMLLTHPAEVAQVIKRHAAR